MASFQVVKGDLFTTTDNYIAHGCNNQGVMGAGVARIIKLAYPWAFEQYKACCPAELGDVIPASKDGVTIFNMITQDQYGYGAKLVYYDAVDLAAQKVHEYFGGLLGRDWQISAPKIGAGLGGGHWPVIEEILKYRWRNLNVTIYEL